MFIEPNIRQSKKGWIEVICGSMFSGKTESLLRELHIFSAMGASVIYVNHSLDTRSSSFSSHHPLLASTNGAPTIDCVKLSSSEELLEKTRDHLIIGIDEAQFFPGLLDTVLHLVERLGKRVLIAGLTANFRREPFGDILSLIPYCDRVTKLSSCCNRCAANKQIRQAHFSFRVTESTEEVDVGGKQKYIPLCRGCFLEKSR